MLSSWVFGVGTGPGQLASRPLGIAVDGVGRVYVADTGNNRIEIFDSSGAFLETFGTFGNGPGEFATPAHVAVDASGNIFVTDANNFRIQVFGQTVGVDATSWGTVKARYR